MQLGYMNVVVGKEVLYYLVMLTKLLFSHSKKKNVNNDYCINKLLFQNILNYQLL